MACVLISGCASEIAPSQANMAVAGNPPSVEEARELLKLYVQIPGRFYDPDAVKDVAIGVPTLWKIPAAGSGAVWIVPFTFNAKNLFGAYVGVQQWQLYVSNGQINMQAQNLYDNLKAVQRGVQQSLN
jgi:hypothetical protein